MNSSINEIKNVITSAENILVLTHQNPDGDAIGSALAVYHAIKQLNKKVDIIMLKYPNIFSFLPSFNEIRNNSDEEYDLVITTDCADINRVEQPKPFFQNAKNTINIDHHRTNNYFANYNYIEKEGPATTQTLYELFQELNITITKEIGDCLITGLITDTGGFKYQTVSSKTFKMAADLYDIGVNISYIYIKVLQTKSKPQFELSKLATSRIEFFCNDQVGFSYITLKDEENCKANPGDHEGIVDIIKSIEGIEVAVFLHESEEGFKVSLRSNNSVDVSKIADVLGGGGHFRAAGCLIKESIEEAKKILIEEISKSL